MSRCVIVVLLLVALLASISHAKKLALPKEITSNLQPCDGTTTKKGDFCTLPLLAASPTQLPVGLGEIYCKIQKLENNYASETKLIEKYLHKNPVPVVKGPSSTGGNKRNFYVVDHHHLIVALYKSSFDADDFPTFTDVGKRFVIAQVVDDLTTNFTSASTVFWNYMFSNGFAYPRDESGKNLTITQFMTSLPPNIMTMRNDPYRALSYYDRSYGGYGKPSTNAIYFVDFVWGNFLRTYGGNDMSSKLTPFQSVLVKDAAVKNGGSYDMKSEFKVQTSLIGSAVALSKSTMAQSLPGYGEGVVDVPYCLESYEISSSQSSSTKKKVILLSDNESSDE